MTLMRITSSRPETRGDSGSTRVGEDRANPSARTGTRGYGRSTHVGRIQTPRAQSRGESRSIRAGNLGSSRTTRPGNLAESQTAHSRTRGRNRPTHTETRGGGQSSRLGNYRESSFIPTFTVGAAQFSQIENSLESEHPFRRSYRSYPRRPRHDSGTTDPLNYIHRGSRHDRDPQIRQMATQRDDHDDWLCGFDETMRERILGFTGNPREAREDLEVSGRLEPELRRRPSFEEQLQLCDIMIAREEEVLRQDRSLRRLPSIESITDVERENSGSEEDGRASRGSSQSRGSSRSRGSSQRGQVVSLTEFKTMHLAARERLRGTARQRRLEDEDRQDRSLRRRPSYISMTAGLDMDAEREAGHDVPLRHTSTRRDGTLKPLRRISIRRDGTVTASRHTSTRRNGGHRGTRTSSVVPSDRGHWDIRPVTRRDAMGSESRSADGQIDTHYPQSQPQDFRVRWPPV